MNQGLIRFAVLAMGGFASIWLLEDLALSIAIGPLDSVLSGFVHSLNPGLASKIQALGKEYFSELLSTIKFRWIALCLFGGYFFRFANGPESISISEKKFLWLFRLFIVVLLIYLPDLSKELKIRGQWKSFYEGLPIWNQFVTVFPATYIIQLIVFLLFANGAVLVVARLRPGSVWIFLGLIGLLLGWTYLLILFFGFGKIDHTYASMYSGLWGMLACILFIRQNADWTSFGLRIFQASIWACYFFAGLEKVFLSGYHWFDSGHFQILQFLHPTSLGSDIMQMPVLASFLLVFALMFQLLSPLQWRWQRWGYVNVYCGLVFHLGTWILFGIGGWQSPWIVMLVFLWPVSSKDNSTDY